LPPVLMDGGRRWWLAELADEATLRSAAPDWAAIERLAQGTGSMGLCVYARCQARAYDLAVRAWVGAGRCFEDAASGAANATFAAAPKREADGDGQVWSGGQVQTVVTGTPDWTAPAPRGAQRGARRGYGTARTSTCTRMRSPGWWSVRVTYSRPPYS